MKATHTPGPWTVAVHRRNPRNFVKIEARDSLRVICDAFSHSDEDLANARLIAAAPELLCMLSRVLGEYLMRDPANGPICPLTLEQARAAIARATESA